ncbi:Uncharacterised protein [Mycobacteroides abscessus]|nr:Uncharacterised protein [Mycobacteroides abscessus]
MFDVHRVVFYGSEPLGEVEQLCAHSRADIGMRYVGQLAGGLSHLPGEHPEQLFGRVAVVGNPPAHGVAIHAPYCYGGQRAGLRRSGLRIEYRQLSEHLRRTDQGGKTFGTIAGPPAQCHLPLGDQIHAFTGVARTEYHLIRLKMLGGQMRRGCRHRGRAHAAKHWRFLDRTVHNRSIFRGLWY